MAKRLVITATAFMVTAIIFFLLAKFCSSNPTLGQEIASGVAWGTVVAVIVWVFTK